TFQVGTHNRIFTDPHNIPLAVLLSGGIIGLALWLNLYFQCLRPAWNNRKDRLVFVLSAATVFGLAASLTEGGDFLSRPKEHWFLIWIPMALLTAACLRQRA